MKTAEEMADNLMADIYGDLGLPADDEGCDISIDRIVKALTAYAEERVKEAVNSAMPDLEHVIQIARAEALEEAAKVAENGRGQYETIQDALDDVEEKIRALKAKP